MWACEVCGWVNIGEKDRPCTGFKVEPVGHLMLAGYTAQEILAHESRFGAWKLDEGMLGTE